MQTMDVLSVVYQPRTQREKESTHTRLSFSNLSQLTLTAVAEQVVNPITLCTLLPQGAFGSSSLSLKIHSAKAWQLSVHIPSS